MYIYTHAIKYLLFCGLKNNNLVIWRNPRNTGYFQNNLVFSNIMVLFVFHNVFNY